MAQAQSATAMARAEGFYQDMLAGRNFTNGSPGVRTTVVPPNCHFPCTVNSVSSASFTDDYVLTITGGTGHGFFEPCMFAGGLGFGTKAQSASASFGPVTVTSDSTAWLGSTPTSFRQIIALNFNDSQPDY
jgi:hypothetical protein